MNKIFNPHVCECDFNNNRAKSSTLHCLRATLPNIWGKQEELDETLSKNQDYISMKTHKTQNLPPPLKNHFVAAVIHSPLSWFHSFFQKCSALLISGAWAVTTTSPNRSSQDAKTSSSCPDLKSKINIYNSFKSKESKFFLAWTWNIRFLSSSSPHFLRLTHIWAESIISTSYVKEISRNDVFKSGLLRYKQIHSKILDAI